MSLDDRDYEVIIWILISGTIGTIIGTSLSIAILQY